MFREFKSFKGHLESDYKGKEEEKGRVEGEDRMRDGGIFGGGDEEEEW